jgi:hypothetical protein
LFLTTTCFAENEDNLPKGWTTFAEEKYKCPKGTNSATFFITFLGGLRPFVHRGIGSEPDFETEMNESFYRAASVMKSVGTANHSPSPGMPGIMFYNSMICNNMAAIGWTKDKIRERLAGIILRWPCGWPVSYSWGTLKFSCLRTGRLCSSMRSRI